MSYNAPISTEGSHPAVSPIDISNNPKTFALLQLQRIGYKVGQIKITDFMRRDEDDEIAHKAKQDRSLQEWLDSLRFQDFRDKLSVFIGDQEKVVDQTIDDINETINELKALDGNNGNVEPAITALRNAKTELKTQKTNLKESARDLNKARSIDDIERIATSTENTATNVSRIQSNAQTVQSDVDVLLDLYDAPTSNGKNKQRRGGRGAGGNLALTSHHQNSGASADPNAQAEDKEDNRIIKIGLRLLNDEKDDTKVKSGLNKLIDRFTRPKVKSALDELKKDEPGKKFKRVSDNFDRMSEPPSGKPTPSA